MSGMAEPVSRDEQLDPKNKIKAGDDNQDDLADPPIPAYLNGLLIGLIFTGLLFGVIHSMDIITN